MLQHLIIPSPDPVGGGGGGVHAARWALGTWAAGGSILAAVACMLLASAVTIARDSGLMNGGQSDTHLPMVVIAHRPALRHGLSRWRRVWERAGRPGLWGTAGRVRTLRVPRGYSGVTLLRGAFIGNSLTAS